MNWARDKPGLSDEDMRQVFKYWQAESTVIQIREKNNWVAQIDSLENEKQWRSWVEDDFLLPRGDSGLVLLIAKRTGEQSLKGIRNASCREWLNKLEDQKYLQPKFGRMDTTFAALAQGRKIDESSLVNQPPVVMRGVRTLPFSKDVFEMVAQIFNIHGSIARVISRTDVPVFNCEHVTILGDVAYIYNCRTSNAWDMDLALTVTHFPASRSTFAILFGCSFDIEQEVIMRLSQLKEEVVHPLVLPGLFAEFERTRHVQLVEDMGNDVEARIFELEFVSPDTDGPQGLKAQQKGIDKRTSYLNFAYLRNGLISWNRQLARMARNAQQLIEGELHHCIPRSELSRRNLDESLSESDFSDSPTINMNTDVMHTVGYKIKSRIMAIRDEYDDKIRDCTMRIEGMAMATQWAQGETNVEIALATNRDSRHMRSIALVTMIFLPGTFFASMFSMTFFNWSSGKGSPVETTIWIYVLITVCFTALTIGLWWYIVIFRPSRMKKLDEEEMEEISEKSKNEDEHRSWLVRWWGK